MTNVICKAVLFDCDGVLVESERVCARLFWQDMRARGLDISKEEAAEIYGTGPMELVAEGAIKRGADLPVDWVQRFYQTMFAALKTQTDEVPGAKALVEALATAGIKIAVGSNGPVAKMDITLGRVGLKDLLHPHIYSARDLANPKPAPDIYRHAAAQLGVAPQDCVVVEDSASGARAAKAAGMRCVGFALVADPAKLIPICDVVVRDMADVAAYLGL